ncbi:MAG: glycosyltransferase, partial [Patescibacteria group bacterium]
KNGVDILIDSIPSLLKEVSHLKVCIIGSGPDEKTLKANVEQLGLHDSILFLGEIQNKELSLYLSISDVFVRPSRSEGLGTAFLEAMAARVPIVGTTVGGIPDFLVNRATGLFAKSEDPYDLSKVIAIILQDQDLRKAIIENASRLIVERYDWNLIAGEFDAVFRRLIDEKRILLVSGAYPPDSGGSATYSSLLMKELPKLGFTPTLLTYGINDKKESHIIRVSRAYPKGIRHIIFFAYCLWFSLSSKLVFSVDASMGGGLPARLASICAQKNFFVRVTGEYAWEQGMARFGVKELLDDFQNNTYGMAIETMRAIEHWIVRGADIVIAPSEYLKKIVGGWGANSQKIITIFNSQDISHTRNISKDVAREKLGLPPDSPILLSIGRLLPWKGFSALIEVMNGVTQEHSDARLFIIDDGPEYERLKTKISECNLEKHVFLAGRVSREKVALYLRAADIFVLNTGYEGFSHILIEALASGVPVITTNVGGNPEIIKNGANGILVPYNDKEELQKNILLLLNSPKKREELIEKGIESAKKFTLPTMMNSLEGILNRHVI